MSKHKRKENCDYVIHIIQAIDVPKLDLLSESDPFVKFKCFDKKNKEKEEATFKTLYRQDNPNPFWNCRRKFNGNINDTLQFIIYDKDDISASDEAGRVSIKLKNVALNQPLTLHVKLSRKVKKDTKLVIKLTEFNSKNTNKTIMFIRHGESEWNEAQENKNLKGMYSKTDHPLNKEGIEQAIKLNEAWKACVKDKKKLKGYNMLEKDLNVFLKAKLILSSPLARATQTCILTLDEHKTIKDKGIVFCSNLREIKTLGGADTKSKTMGKKIIERCTKYFKEYKQYNIIKHMKHIKYNYDDVNEKWWTAIKDNKKEFDKRITDFMNFIRYDDCDSIICVGHSLWIKAFFKKYLPKIKKETKKKDKDMQSNYDETKTDDTGNDNNNDYSNKIEDDISDDYLFGRKDDETLRTFMSECLNKDVFDEKKDKKSNEKQDKLYKNLKKKKVENAGCIKVVIDFNDKYDNHVTIKDVQMMFGSQLV